MKQFAGALLFSVFFLLYFPVAQAQPVVDSLRLEIKQAKSDTDKAHVMGMLAWELKFSNPDEAIYFAEEEIKLAEKHKHLNYLADGYRTKAFVLVLQTKLADGLDMYNKAISYARKAGNKIYEASCLSMMAGMYQDKGDYDQALKYYLEGLQIAEQTKNDRLIAVLSNNTASLLADAGRPAEQSLPYFQKALQHVILIQNWSFAGMICANIAVEYHRMGDTKTSESFISRAIDYSEKNPENKYDYATIRYETGNIYLKSGKYAEAEAYLKTSLKVLDSLQMPDNALRPLLALAKLYVRLNQPGQAQGYARRLQTDATNQQAKFFIGEAYKVQSDIARLQKKFEQALLYYEQFSQWNDSVFNEAKERSIANAEAQNLLKQRELETRLKVQQAFRENEILKLTNENLTNEKILAFSICIVLLALGFFLYRAYATKNRHNIELEKQKRIIQTQSIEKDTLITEIHHRVKNNLQIVSSLLSLQAHSLADQQAIDALNESHNRVQTIALLHQKLYAFEKLSAIPLEDYIRQVWQHLQTMYNAAHIELKTIINPANLQLDMESSIPVGLILNELMTNSLKYAFTKQNQGKITVQFEDDQKGMYVFRVSDNGSGIPEQFNPDDSTSLGWRILKELSRQLRGKVSFTNDNGFCFTMVFPKNLNEHKPAG